ncbi:hypothetical protein ACTXK0_14755 [Corynebacterium variabile]|uniref:hypothetical protein n=1 Tax=Corynebacterium variabile TaxID=1727 RepID=UPI0011464188|nr:hypothetical protein [Corynebacterium variabile]
MKIPNETPAIRIPLILSLAFSIFLLILTAVIFSSQIPEDWIRAADNVTGNSPHDRSFGSILATNASTALFLYSGAITLGLTSIAATGLLGAFIGASMRTVVSNVGFHQMFSDGYYYMPFEFLGFILSATAGFLPIACFFVSMTTRRNVRKTFSSYADSLPWSLAILVVGITLISVGALSESIL